MTRGQLREQRGGISAELVAVMLVVAGLIAIVLSIGLPRIVGDRAEQASCSLFSADPCGEPEILQASPESGDAGPSPSRSVADDSAAADDLLDPTAPLREHLPTLRERGQRELEELRERGTGLLANAWEEVRGRVAGWWDASRRWATERVRRVGDRFDPPARWVEDGRSGERRRPGDTPSGDDQVDAVYAAAETFENYLADRFDRDGLDGQGGTMIGLVYDEDTPNARWSRGQERTSYAEGWAVESIAHHEFAHGLVYYLTGGISTSTAEGHAVNEALADIFAMNITGAGTVGHELPPGTPGAAGGGPIRIPEDPTRHARSHPDHVSDFDENLGGHHNSTIISHAYHRVVEEIGRDAAEQVVYRALDRHVDQDVGFEDLRAAMLVAAEELHGDDSDERDGIHRAFADVGLDGTWQP